MRPLTLTGKVTLALGVTLVLLVLLGGGATYVALRQAQSARHAARVTAHLRHLAEAGAALRDAQRGQRGYILTGDERYLVPYHAAHGSFTRVVDTLRAEVPLDERAHFDSLEARADTLIAMFDSTITAREPGEGGGATSLRYEDEIKRRSDALFADLDAFERRISEEFNAVSTRAERRAWTTVTLTLLIGIAAVLALGLAGGRLIRALHAHLRSERGLAESEARFDTAFAAAPTALVISGLADGRIRSVNAAFTRLTGHSHGHAVGRPLRAAGLPDDALRPAASDDLPPSLELEVQRADGTRRHALAATAIVAFAGEPCLLTLLHDITERKAAEEALGRTNVMLAHRNRELEDFAHVASHDLQEPLRKIRAFSDLLRTERASELGDGGRFYVERIEAAAAHMSALIAALLEFSRVASRPRPFENVDVARAAGDVVASLEREIEERRAHVEIDAPMVVDADPYQLRQLLRHLLLNALTFHPPESRPRIHIRARETHGGARPGGRGPACRIEVRDNGIGFDERYLDKVFAPFQRLHRRDRFPGSGMGLAIVRRIAERHHGTATARSTPGRGSTFIVLLPLDQAAPPAGNPATRTFETDHTLIA